MDVASMWHPCDLGHYGGVEKPRVSRCYARVVDIGVVTLM